MGRTLAAVLVLGLLAGGGWFAYARIFAKSTPAAPAVPPAGAGDLPVPGAWSLSASPQPDTGTPPAQASPAMAGEIRALLQAGKAREAVAKAGALQDAALRDPSCAGSAREAGLALASGTSSGPADRLARADEARRLLGRLAAVDAVPLETVRDRIESLNRELLFGGREVPGVLFRGAVKPGDTLDRLMKKDWKGRVKAGYGVVLWLNNLPSPDRLRVGNLWVPEEPLGLLVRKHEHQLWVLLGGVPVRFFPVGLGMNGRTPEGTFEIEEMMPRPDYWPAGGKRIPFGQKGNPLGTRWMGFRDTPEAQGFGIHGTEDPQSIGKDESQGCVRLRNEDVEQLFTWVSVGTKVEIRP